MAFVYNDVRRSFDIQRLNWTNLTYLVAGGFHFFRQWICFFISRIGSQQLRVWPVVHVLSSSLSLTVFGLLLVCIILFKNLHRQLTLCCNLKYTFRINNK